MMMVVMVVVVVMMMVTTGAVEELSELHATVTRFGAPRIVRPQIRSRVRNRIEKIAVTQRYCKLIRLRRHNSVGRAEGRKRGSYAE